MMLWTMKGVFKDDFETTVFGITSKDCIYALMTTSKTNTGSWCVISDLMGKSMLRGR